MKQELEETSECEIITKIRYLGIEITTKNLDLFKYSYTKLWTALGQDIVKWEKLKLSFFL